MKQSPESKTFQGRLAGWCREPDLDRGEVRSSLLAPDHAKAPGPACVQSLRERLTRGGSLIFAQPQEIIVADFPG